MCSLCLAVGGCAFVIVEQRILTPFCRRAINRREREHSACSMLYYIVFVALLFM